MRATLAALVVALGVSTSAYAAGTVHLAIHDGRVDLTASGASIPQILDEWARVGDTRVVNGDRLPAVPVTLELNNVPEKQAIEILLRSAAGFIAVPRQAAAGPSQFERIMILATSNPPAVSAAERTFPAATPPPFAGPPPVRVLPSGATPVLGPDGRPVPDDQEGAPAPAAPATYNSMPPGFAAPPAMPAAAAPPAAAPATAAPATAPAPAPSSTVGGSSVPGTVVKPQPPRRPGGE